MWNDVPLAADAGTVHLRALVSLFIKLFLCNTLCLAGYLMGHTVVCDVCCLLKIMCSTYLYLRM